MLTIDDNKVCPECGGYGDGEYCQNCGFHPKKWINSEEFSKKNPTVYEIKACGLTSDYRPNIVIDSGSLWYHTTFYKHGPALEFLGTLYESGVLQSDIDDGLWLTLQELQQQK
jgi:hypothetical protein